LKIHQICLSLLLATLSICSYANPILYEVNYPYSDIQAINVRNIQAEGYGTGAFGMKVKSSYHFRFNDGTVVRFEFITKYSTIKFLKAGDPVTNIFTDRDFAEIYGHINWNSFWVDSTGGASTSGSGQFVGHFDGYTKTPNVKITDLPPLEPLSVIPEQ